MKRALAIVFIFFFGILNAQETHIIPTPQKVQWTDGDFIWDSKVTMSYDSSLERTANLFRKEINQIKATDFPLQAKPRKGAKSIEISLVDHIDAKENNEQAYKLTISPNFIRVEAETETGIFYGLQSLKQLYRYHRLLQPDSKSVKLPCLNITDWPDLRLRGWMDDISRGPIVSMEYLKKIIPLMAEYKLNYFTLYTEHTFRTETHPDIAPLDGLTAQEIKDLEAFARPYHIDIFGNQQCLAHFEKTLCSPFYSKLADTKHNLNPALEETYVFLNEQLKEIASAYSSPYFNINCDETEGLGSGNAKAYVDSIGQETAYFKHVNRINGMMESYGKKALMWGDIAANHPDIIKNLDKDIIMLAWSYVAKDNYQENILPLTQGDRQFLVAPGTSMWGDVWPDMANYKINIANFCRDGHKNGALGIMNTCWDDSGESFITSALHGIIWGAETSWKTQEEASDMFNSFNRNFNIQFFNTFNDITATLLTLNEKTKESGLNTFGAMTQPITPFYPSQLDENFVSLNRKAIIELTQMETAVKEAQSIVTTNKGILDNALYAIHRLIWTAKRNMLRKQLHDTFQSPNESNIADSKSETQRLILELHNLKCEYIELWKKECRAYWLDVNLKKYDELARELQDTESLPFITTSTDEQGSINVEIRTIYNDKAIRFSTDGSEIDNHSSIYKEPITIHQSCIVKAKCENVKAEKYFLFHKGIGKLKSLNSVAGNYRPEYSGGCDNALLDGNLGGTDYKDGHWQGFYGQDADIEIDFKQREHINNLEIGFLANAYDWILRPNEIEILTSSDGHNYKRHAILKVTSEVTEKGNFVFRENFKVDEINTRYMRIIIKNPGLIPEGLPGSGYDSWIFMDEIEVR